MTNPTLMGDFAAAQQQMNTATLVHENVRADQAIEIRWRDEIIRLGMAYEGMLHKNAGRSVDDDNELFGGDLVNGLLTNHTLTFIASKKGKCKEFVMSRCMTKKDDPAFKTKYGNINSLAVSKIGRLLVVYPAVKAGTASISELPKEDKTWILLAALMYDKPVILTQMNPTEEQEEGTIAIASNEENDVPVPASSRTLIVDADQSISVAEYCFLDNTELLNELSCCMHGVVINRVTAPLRRERVVAAKNQLSQRLQIRINLLPKHVRSNFVFAACRDNIHSFAQIFAMFGQVPDNLEAASNTESILEPQLDCYHRPIEIHPEDKLLEGVGIYMDTQKMKFKQAALAYGKSFQEIYNEDEERSKQSNLSSELSKQYPFNKPSNAELGGWTGTHKNLELCIGLGIKRDGNNSCLTRKEGGAFVWTDRTLIKLGGISQDDTLGKQIRFVLQMTKFMYTLMMGSDAIDDGIPFRQYLGPILN